jgi:hypothetical protein|tara:strand:+ start:728 stop:1249 length:522 start_codon:yes stop_codon:yes gene_type:complete
MPKKITIRNTPEDRLRELVNTKVSPQSAFVSDNFETNRRKAKTKRKENSSTTTSFVPSAANTVYTLSAIQVDESLNEILISHYSASDTESKISIHWSTTPINKLSFTVSSGLITATSGGKSTRLVSTTIPSESSFSLSAFLETNKNLFRNDDKVVYLYVVCSVLGVEFTIVKE